MEKPGFIKRFFSFLLRVCVVLVLMVAIAVASFEGVSYYLTGSLVDLVKMAKEETDQNTSQNDSSEASTEVSTDSGDMENTIIFVQSEEADKVYMALHMYNKKTKVLDILLVPADAQVSVGSSLLEEIRETMNDAGSSLNLEDVARVFGDEKYEMLTKIMSDVSGLSISRQDVLSEKDFIKVLSLAGTVNYQLDYAISYRDEDGVLQTIENGDGEETDAYSDDSGYGDDNEYDDDGEYDDGETTEGGDTAALDGQKAYVLLTYLDGTDSQESNRLERCADYLETFYDQLIAKDDAKRIAKSYNRLAESTGDDEITSKKKILKNLTDDALTIRVMQGSESGGVFTLDSQKVKLQASTLIKQADSYSESGSAGNTSEEDTDDASETGSATESSKDYSIELYNAAYVSGLAGSWETFLEGEGYNISLIDSYQDEGPLSQTRIYVTEEGMGEDLLTWFSDAEITVVDEISTGGDIQVFIGTDSTDVPTGNSDVTESTEEDETDTGDDYLDEDGGSSTDDADDTGDGDGYSFDTDS